MNRQLPSVVFSEYEKNSISPLHQASLKGHTEHSSRLLHSQSVVKKLHILKRPFLYSGEAQAILCLLLPCIVEDVTPPNPLPSLTAPLLENMAMMSSAMTVESSRMRCTQASPQKCADNATHKNMSVSSQKPTPPGMDITENVSVASRKTIEDDDNDSIKTAGMAPPASAGFAAWKNPAMNL